MNLSRRRFLRSGALLGALGLGGCTSRGVSYPSSETPSGGATPTRTATPATETPSPEATPVQETPRPVSPLERATHDVFSELDWFATAYARMLTEHRARANRLYDLVRTLRRQPALDANDVRRLERTTGEFLTHLQTNLGPHFDATDSIVRRVATHLETVEKFSNRSDLDRVDRELDELSVYLDRVQSKGYIDSYLSDRPIRGPFVRSLTSPDYDPAEPVVFLVAHPDGEFVTTARVEADWSFQPTVTTSVTWQDRNDYLRRQTTLFDGLSVAEGRRGHGFVAVHQQPGPVEARPTYIQQFESARAATRARETLLSGALTQEGTATLGETEWRRVYYYQEIDVVYLNEGYTVYDEEGDIVYDEDGDVLYDDDGITRYTDRGDVRHDEEGDILYAYLAQTGRYLVGVAPSLTAWEERPESATEPLTHTWLWNPAPDDASSDR